MADEQLLKEVSGFLAAQDAEPLRLDTLDSQQLITDTDELLRTLEDDSSTSKRKNTQSPHEMSKQDIARIKAGQRRDAYRRRLKAEWQSLRQQDQELSSRLEELKRPKPVQEAKSEPEDSLGLAAWRAIAMRQYESRLESEELRKRLKTAVERRAVMIQDLESVLKKRVREVETLAEVPVLEKKARNGMDALYNTYFDDLDALYTRLDEVFREVGTTPTPGGILAGEPVRKVDGDTEYFETLGVGRVPFSYQRTCDAVWQLAAVPHRHEGRREYAGLPDPGNSLAIQFNSPLRRDNGEVSNLRTYHVARRYVEESRLVLVWRALCEPDGDFPGLNSDETGWCVVHAPSSNVDADDGPATLVQACIRFVPMHFQDGNHEREEKMDQFVKLLVETGQEDYQEIERMMERLMLDDALATDGLEFDEHGNLTSTTF